MSDETNILTIFSEKVRTLNMENQTLFQRSLVDLALADRHEYWDVSKLLEAIEEFGFVGVIQILQNGQQSLSTRVLIQALETVGIRSQRWSDGTIRYKFLTLWRELCQDYGWEEQARQTEGLLFDFRLPSLQKRVVLEQFPKQRLDVARLGLMSTLNGDWLMDVSRDGIRTWDANTGEEGPFWSVECPILQVLPEEGSQVVITTQDGRLYRWDLLFQIHQELDDVATPLVSICCRSEKIGGWSQNSLFLWDEDGVRKLEIEARFRSNPELAISEDGQRIMACDGSTIGVWSCITGSVIFGMGFHSGLNADEIDKVESILDMGQTEYGLRLMDRMDLWGLRLKSQYNLVRTLSDPLAMSTDDKYVVMGDGETLAWLEWDEVDEEYVVRNQITVPDLWSVTSVKRVTENCRILVACGAESLVAWDFAQGKEARYPLEIPLGTKLTVFSTSKLIVCDDTRSISIFLFRAD